LAEREELTLAYHLYSVKNENLTLFFLQEEIMAYTMIDNYGTQFAVDWETVARLNSSYHRSDYQWGLSTVTKMSESAWYNPFSWSLPTTKTVEVEWPKVRERAKYASYADMDYFRGLASRDMRAVAEEVRYQVEQTSANLAQFKRQLKEVQIENAAAIEESVDDYEGLIEAAKFVRDTSADIVVVGSTIATGGAAAGLLGAGSVMKGIAKYQDTGSAGAALLQGGGTLFLGSFKIGGAKLTAGAEYTLIIAKGALEAGTSLVAGDSFGTAVEKGSLKIASAGAAQFVFSAPLAKTVFERMPLPFTVWSTKIVTDSGWMQTDVANKVAAGVTKKLFERGVKAGAKNALAGTSPSLRIRAQISGLADEVPIEKKILLHFSIVNMAKGVGHGW